VGILRATIPKLRSYQQCVCVCVCVCRANRHGFVAVSIDYRLSATSFLPELAAIRDAVEDTKAAVRWLVVR
jgi:hypothetical protein